MNDLYFRLLPRRTNDAADENTGRIPFLDLSLAFFRLPEDRPESRNVTVLEELTREWFEQNAVTPKSVWKQALSDTMLRFPAVLRDMGSMLLSLGLSETVPAADPDDMFSPCGLPLYVLTNRDSFYGASCLLYPGLAKKIAKTLGGDYYILPSSVHETILLRTGGEADPEYLRNLVREVNSLYVTPQEYLSDEVYMYSLENDGIGLAPQDRPVPAFVSP